MHAKLTLTLDDAAIALAKQYAKQNDFSLSKLVELYFKNLTDPSLNQGSTLISPLTKDLSGIVKLSNRVDGKTMLKQALAKKFLSE